MTRFPLASLGRVLGSIALAGCISAPEGTATDAEGSELRLTVLDAHDRPSPERALPRRPRLVLNSQPGLDPSAAQPLLFEGTLDAELQQDLERMPLTASNARRVVPCSTRYQNGELSLLPKHTLDRGADYTLAVPRSGLPEALRDTLDQAWTRALRSADDPSAGAAISGTLPANAATGLPTQLEFAVLAFDGVISGVDSGIWLEDAQGWAVPARVESVPCAALETGADSCVRLTPSEPLAALSSYWLRSGRTLRDAHDAEVEPVSVEFTTGGEQATAELGWQLAGCAVDESATPVGCALIGDESIQLRLLPSGPGRVLVQLDERRVARLASGQPFAVSFEGLLPDTLHAVMVAATDPAGTLHTLGFSLGTSAELATLSIQEVRADPLGPEPAQEYVEILNFGGRDIALLGCSLSDASDQTGTRIEQAISLPPGARALLVADAFDIASQLDVPPAAGALLVRLGSALTRSGLSNAGEPLFLRDAEQHRLSSAPPTPAPRAGVCNVRTGADPRSGAPGTFSYALEHGCTPGL
jgi:hypothetical protein